MLITLVSVKGAPGVTTLAHALAVNWPQPTRRVLVEADPSGGDLATRFALAPTPGLVSLAAARGDRDLLWQHTQTLPDGLPVVAGPPGADQTRASLRAWLSHPSTQPDDGGVGLVDAETVAVVDCGRIGPGSPAMPLVETADAMLLLTRAHPADLIHIASSLPTLAGWTRHPALLLVGRGCTTTEVAHELGIPVMARIPHDRRGVADLGRNRARSGRVRHALTRAAHDLAKALDAQRHTPAPRDAAAALAHERPGTPGHGPNGAST